MKMKMSKHDRNFPLKDFLAGYVRVCSLGHIQVNRQLRKLDIILETMQAL